jgi:hypothetical protein
VLFSKNCIGCKRCFGCINLRNKEYWFLNQPCSKEEYEKKLAALGLDRSSGIHAATEKVTMFFADFPRKYYNGANIEDSSGDYILQTKGSHAVFNCRDIENMQHCQDVWRARNCQDLTETVENDFCYSLEGCALSTNTLFSKKFYDSSNAIYCSHCNGSHNIFGCVALNHGKHCILNKQYSKDEYETLVPKIIEHMRTTGEWGHSPFGYNETVAQEYFPLTRKQALENGYSWRDAEDDIPQVERIISADQVPDSIDDVPDGILQWAITCPVSGRRFKIIKQEVAFCRSMRLPLPRMHPDERHRLRMGMRNPRRLWERECMKCKKAIQTTYSPERPETVYCEECYLKEVY